MDRHPQSTPQIEQLIRLSAASRSQLSQQAAAVRQRLDVPGRVLNSLRRHPSAWLGGVLTTAVTATFLLRRPPTTTKRRRGWSGLLGSLAFSAARPLVKAWLTTQLQQFVMAQIHSATLLRQRSNNNGYPKSQSPS